MARIDTVKGWIGADASSQRTDRLLSRSGDAVYLERLRKEVEHTKQYIKQADIAISSLKQADRQDSASEKRRVVALYDSYARVPFVPDKDEVIGSATASTALRNSVEDYSEAIATLSESKVDPEELTLLMDDYRDIVHHTSRTNEKGLSKLKEMDSKLAELEQEVSLVNRARTQLKSRLKDADQMSSLLSLHLKRVLTKYLAVQNWEEKVVMDSPALKSTIRLIMLMIDDLLTAPQDSWVEIVPTSITAQLVKILVFKSIVISREDSTPSIYYLRIRNFGIQV
ncbi:uncharacterized protein CANTADRAFT_4744 [Suhomyces tanzawaensis NRRL Y-17324]|uniref:Uncharacterized protein n=1 Tax=Suhomyces tanzawaensis NRRL Y-17324 TaxID=984487 RepID=A0A1E4SMH8_9ASCO|nr:uncharacterized protein CANTADRAFT_4744 [Suhomyces tanzawaensis NRRL Y-17324]ODV80734.1 hypothetical protein CANTADRAFT_4744 [Suhomyces tanzawaensis NRRL Y-17324]